MPAAAAQPESAVPPPRDERTSYYVRTMVRLPPPLYARLPRLAQERGVRIEQLIQQAVEQVYGPPHPAAPPEAHSSRL